MAIGRWTIRGLVLTLLAVGTLLGHNSVSQADSSTVTPWACSVGDTSSGCSSTTLSPAPTARYRFAAAAGTDGKIYAMGGSTGTSETPLGANEAYDPIANTWSTLTSMVTPRKDLGVAAGLDGRIYAIDGSTATAEQSTVEAYVPRSDTWQTLPDSPYSLSQFASVTGLDGRIYLIGGTGGAIIPNVFTYTPSTNTWAEVASMHTARADPGAAVGPDGRIYAVGGQVPVTGGSVATNVLEVYTPSTNSWRTLPHMPTARSDATTVTGPDGRIYVIGGRGDVGGFFLVEAYDPLTATWDCSTDDSAPSCASHTLIPMPTGRDTMAGALGSDGRIYVISGDAARGLTHVVESFAPLKSVSSGVARAGTVATIHGTGYQAGETVTVTWNCSAPDCSSTKVLGTPTADASGNWSLSFTVPAFSAGGYPIGARGNSSSTFAARDFIVAPAATLSSTPSTARGNTTATLTGTNFAPGETVTIKWNCGAIDCTSHYTLLPTGERSFQGVKVIGTATADSTGSFTHAFTVPNFSAGNYPIGAIGGTSNAFARTTFTVAAPASVTITPSSGHPGSGYAASGTGFQSGETVTVKFNCSSQSCSSLQTLGTATAQSDGTFSIPSVTIPNFSARSYPVAAIGGTSNTLATTTFTVN